MTLVDENITCIFENMIFLKCARAAARPERDM